MKNIPIIIPVFNQLTYLRNLINWWKFYYPENPIYIMDNGSTNEELISNYDHKIFEFVSGARVFRYRENSFISNLTDIIKNVIEPEYSHYVISDPDIMPHPSTPGNFLEIWKEVMEVHKLHRIGFGLIIDDLPEGLNNRANIIHNESELIAQRDFDVILEQGVFKAYKAPIDTTFCLYKTANGGWSAPMSGPDWGNCVRMFKAFHLPWHQDPKHVNEEMDFYYKSCKSHVHGEPSAGKNNNKPTQYQ